MGPAPSSEFAHRENRDGTFDSICRKCFLTVATKREEADLSAAERVHICDPAELERFELMRKLERAPVQREQGRGPSRKRVS